MLGRTHIFVFALSAAILTTLIAINPVRCQWVLYGRRGHIWQLGWMLATIPLHNILLVRKLTRIISLAWQISGVIERVPRTIVFV